MNERVTTWGDLLERRMGRRFVGRRREIEPFRLNFLYTVPPTLLFVAQGPPGIGKSALLAQYRAIAREHGFVTASVERWDIRLPGEFAAVHAMSVLARQLSTAGVPLTTFSEVYREYIGALQAIERDASAPGHVWDLFGGVADADPWAVRVWDEYLVRTFPLRRSPLIRDPVGSLTERFVLDLNAWATVRRIVLCFDDWQIAAGRGRVEAVQLGQESDASVAANSAGYRLEDWLYALLADGGLSTNIWFLLADRHPLPDAWESLSSITTTFDLQPLSHRESLALLRDAGGLGDEIASQEADQAEGNPLWLTLLVSGPNGAAPDGSMTPIERYVASLEPVLRAAVLKCAAARWLDEGVIAVLLGDEAVARVMAWLKRTPLVAKCGEGWRFQQAVRAPLEELARLAGSSTWEAAHQTLSAYYRQRSELSGVEPQYLDPEWQRDHLEALYHNFIIGDEAMALNAGMLSFLNGVRRFYPWAGAVAAVWTEASSVICAGQLCDPPGAVQVWEQRVSDGWQALVTRDWATIYAFADEGLEVEMWDPEVRQSLRALSQLAAGRLALPVEEEGAPEPSVPVPPRGFVQDKGPEREGAQTPSEALAVGAFV